MIQYGAGLFEEIGTKRLSEKILNLIEKNYDKTMCAVKYQGKLTKFLNYSKGVRVRLGWPPLSPLIFNLYDNDIHSRIDNLTPNSAIKAISRQLRKYVNVCRRFSNICQIRKPTQNSRES